MAVSRGRKATTKKTTARKPAARTTNAPGRNSSRGTAKARTKPAPKANASQREQAAQRDVTQYADKPATDFHKFLARFIVNQIGYDPDSAKSKRAAFLAGVSIATAARPAINASDELAEWRKEMGVAKRGPKRDEQEETKRRAQREIVPDSEFEPEESEEDTDEEGWTEEDLKGLKVTELRKVAKDDFKLTFKVGTSKADMISAILAEQGEEDDDDEDVADDEEFDEDFDGDEEDEEDEDDDEFEDEDEDEEDDEDEDFEEEEEEEEEEPPARSKSSRAKSAPSRAPSRGTASTSRASVKTSSRKPSAKKAAADDDGDYDIW